MTDYWKSTPRYWCKHCSVYVRDTGLERSNHEATGKHQGNLARFLRNIHRESERESITKERAKEEVARLNGLTSGDAEKPTAKAVSVDKPSLRQATFEDRKAQMAQLASLGVAIPDAYRQDMAMASDWVALPESTVSPMSPKPGVLEVAGKRKERTDNFEDEPQPNKRPAWGSITRTIDKTEYSGAEFDALLEQVSQARKPKAETPTVSTDTSVKHALTSEEDVKSAPDLNLEVGSSKIDELQGEEDIVFKKRKSRPSKK